MNRIYPVIKLSNSYGITIPNSGMQKDRNMQNIIFGISGKELTEDEHNLIQEKQPHGIILFSRNCQSREQIIELNKSIKAISPKTRIFIDQEGGRVRRVKPPVSSKDFPSMEGFNKLYDQDKTNSISQTKQNFYELMSELLGLGIDITSAPVCDLIHEGQSNVIGDRSFGANAQKVIDLAGAALDGIHEAGGEGVLKHIPGHGRSTKDSHHDLPVVDAPLEELEKTDFAVFKALAGKCAYAMTAHIIYPSLDSQNPATFSPNVIKYIREQIGFKGLIMPDALEMKALDKIADIQERARLCLEAGCDLPLYCTGEMEGVQDVMLALSEMSHLS